MVRRIRFIYRKSYTKFGNDPVHLWKVLEGPGGPSSGPTTLGGLAWAEGVLPSLMGQGHMPLKAQPAKPLGFPQNPRGDQLGGEEIPLPPLGRRPPNPRWERGPPQPTWPPI